MQTLDMAPPPRGEELTEQLEQSLLALGICAMWISQWCRVLLRSADLGPLVLMAQQMVFDVLRFLVLLSGIFYAFAVALVVLFRGEVGGAKPLLEEDCMFLDDRGHGAIVATLVVLIEVLLEAIDPPEIKGVQPWPP